MHLTTLFIILAIFTVAIVAPPHKEPGTGVACHQCGGRGHEHFPACLLATHRCHEDEYCYLGRHHAELKGECWSKHDCSHILNHRDCSLSHEGCEVCCSTELCVAEHLVQVHPAFPVPHKTTAKPHIITQPPVHTTTTTRAPATTQDNLWSRFLYEPCRDIMAHSCESVSSAFCEDPYGVSLCPEQCGLCPRLNATFGGQTICADQLLGDACVHTANVDFCNSVIAESTCPKSCNLCDRIITETISKVILANKNKPAFSTVSMVTVTPVPTAGTTTPTVPVQVTETTVVATNIWDRFLVEPCDDILVTGCSNTNFCLDVYGVSTCPDTCGLCSRLSAIFNGQTICQDELKNDECKHVATPDFCKSIMAPASCAKTCNLCDTLLHSLIDEVIAANNKSMATTIPRVATTMPTVLMVETSKVVQVVQTTPQPVVLTTPEPVATDPVPVSTKALPVFTDAVTTAMPVAMTVTNTIAVTTEMPIAVKVTDAIAVTTGMAVAVTVTDTMATDDGNQGVTLIPSVASDCVDTVQICASIQGVCQDSNAPNICRKFCGLCGTTV